MWRSEGGNEQFAANRQQQPGKLTNLAFRKGRRTEGGPFVSARLSLLDHFNDAMAAGINQHRPIVDDRVAVFASAVFLRHFVVRHACFRKFGAHPDVALIAV